MKLLYVWIENFKDRILKQEFLLGGPYKIQFNEETNEFCISENKNYIENFYSLSLEASPIKVLTGIVGKNGSGKTTLLEFFRYSSADIYKLKNQKFVEVFLGDDGLLYYYQNNMSNAKFEKEVAELNKKARFNLSKVLFLSTVLDRKKYIPLSRENNYSTNYLLEKAEEFESEKIKQNLIFLNRREEILRSRNVQEDHLNEIMNNIPLPSTLRVSLMYKVEVQPTFIDQLIYSMISHYIHNRMILPTIEQEEIILLKQYATLLDEKGKSGSGILEAIKNMEFDKKPFYRRENHETVFKRINKFASYIEHGIQEETITLLADGQLEIRDLKIMQQFIKKLSVFTKNQFSGLSLYWRELSTGEEMILDIFSRLMEGINKNKNQPSLQLIIIDEIENALHPQWQKQIIAMFIRFLEFYYPKLKFQIILTSHSPFLVSDIPSDCLLFLEYDQQNKVRKKSSLDELHLTFGANIHDLYAHSFFLKGGLMGDFAKNKINHLAKQMLDYMPGQELDWGTIRKQINLVGEPILRSRLIKLYDDKRKLSETVQEDIVTMKKELEALQNQMEVVQKRIKDFEQQGGEQ